MLTPTNYSPTLLTAMFSKMVMSFVLDVTISSVLIIKHRRANTEVAITPTRKKEISLRPRSIMYDIKI